MMTLKIAWKNIWRNPVRSAVIIISVVLGVWAALFIISFSNGMNEQRLHDLLKNYTGHVVVENPAYAEEKAVQYTIEDPDAVLAEVKRQPGIDAWSARTLANGMAQTSSGSYGVQILGIDTLQEMQVTNFHEQLVEGDFLYSFTRNSIVIGEKLANRLKLDIRSKIILTFQNTAGDITAGAFRVSGIYKSHDAQYDETHVYVRQHDLQQLLGSPEAIHQVFALLNDYKQAPTIAAALNAGLSQSQARHWAEISPQLSYMDEAMQQFMLIFIGIIALGLTLGIVNVMLMAILERSRELGMLMAIGMNRKRVFSMITTETILLTAAGLPLGLLLTFLTIGYFQENGIDLSVASDAMASLGYNTMVYPQLEATYYWQVALIMLATTLLGSIYPSLKAMQLKPVEAIRKI